MLHRFRFVRPVAPAALLLTLLLGACSSGGGKAAAAHQQPKNAASVTLDGLKLGVVNVQSAGPPVNIDNATRSAALAVAQKYVDTAIVAPLRDGSLGAGYASLFDTGIAPVATTTDSPALTDAQVGKLEGYHETTTPVMLSALADQTGALLYLATNFTLQVKSTSKTEPLTISRTVELTLTPNAQRKWVVGAYRVLVARQRPTGTTTATAQSGGTKP